MSIKKKSKPIKPVAKPKIAPKAKTAPRKAAKINAVAPAPVPVSSQPKEQVVITKAKGRPMLSWVGKRSLRVVTAFPAQYVESFTAPGADKIPVADATIWKEWPEKYSRGGLLFHGDNKEVLAHLLANGFRGRVQLIYIDPPFDSGADYVRKVNLRGSKGTAKLDGESYSLGEQIQYTDIWANDNYLQFMYERLMLLKELLSEKGSIFLHCDDQKNYLLRAVLDEVFGQQNFRNEIVWKRSTSTGLATRRCGTLHDTIYWYSKSDLYTYIMQYHEHDEDYLKRARKDESGRLYIPIPTGNPGPRPNLYYEYKGYWPHSNGYKWTKEKMEQYDREGRLIFPENKAGRIQYKQYLDEIEGVKLQDLWTDVFSVNPVAVERLDYPTQKPESLLQRIVSMSTKPGDLVLDCFIGSGTTASVAQALGRCWIGCDINKGAIQTTTKRLQSVIAEQVTTGEEVTRQVELIADDKPKPAPPSQLGFTIHRVNDYDLAIQHNEAVNLACEHIGVTRTHTDAFFDGTLGKKLVKIVPFGHPLSPADLEDVKRELDARANESRDVVVVCLGKELGVDPWLSEWNRIRKQGDTPNKIEVIELRSDPRYGKFIAHKSAQARVDIRRVRSKDGDKLMVEVKDFISPSIAERLQDQGGLLAPKIPDWRAMVDTVMIDPTYDGKVFNIALVDVPERKQDYIQAKYELPAPTAKTTVAVKVTDMLGEEVIVIVTV